MVWSDSGKTFTGPNCIRQLAAEARSPGVTYAVGMAKVQDWLDVVPQGPERQNREGATEGIARFLMNLEVH
jgi:hypothetical protein